MKQPLHLFLLAQKSLCLFVPILDCADDYNSDRNCLEHSGIFQGYVMYHDVLFLYRLAEQVNEYCCCIERAY